MSAKREAGVEKTEAVNYIVITGIKCKKKKKRPAVAEILGLTESSQRVGSD